MRLQLTIAAVLSCGVALAPAITSPAAAQSSPSADQLIQALRPGASSTTSRGIRQISPSGDAAAPHAATPGATHAFAGTARPPAGAVQGPSANLTVNFASGSADLTPQAIHALDELGRALTNPALAGFRFRIEGHTDTVGTPESNKALSERRATAVVDYLGTKWGVDKTKVEAVGMGEEQLLVPTGPNVPQPRNRRVTVINVGA
jgi:OOP family OmpA-OmpF porin